MVGLQGVGVEAHWTDVGTFPWESQSVGRLSRSSEAHPLLKAESWVRLLSVAVRRLGLESMHLSYSFLKQVKEQVT